MPDISVSNFISDSGNSKSEPSVLIPCFCLPIFPCLKALANKANEAIPSNGALIADATTGPTKGEAATKAASPRPPMP